MSAPPLDTVVCRRAAEFHDLDAAVADRRGDRNGACGLEALLAAAADRGRAGNAGEDVLKTGVIDDGRADHDAAGIDNLSPAAADLGAGGGAF